MSKSISLTNYNLRCMMGQLPDELGIVGAKIVYDTGLVDIEKIMKKTGADAAFIQDVMRMYLTHQNVGVQGILDRIEIKGK